MNLRHMALQVVSAVRRGSQLTPNVLAALEKTALGSWDDGFVSTFAPMAPYTWEASTYFLGANATSERVSFTLPFPCQIVGLFFSLVETSAGGLATPTLTDLEVSIDINNERYQNSLSGQTNTNTASRDGAFVTVSALQSPARLWGLSLPGPTLPVLGFTWRWKRGAAVYRDQIVRCAMFARKLEG